MRISFFRNLNTNPWKKWNYEFILYAYIWIIRTMCRVIPSTWARNFNHAVRGKKYKKNFAYGEYIVPKNYELFYVIWLKSKQNFHTNSFYKGGIVAWILDNIFFKYRINSKNCSTFIKKIWMKNLTLWPWNEFQEF